MIFMQLRTLGINPVPIEVAASLTTNGSEKPDSVRLN